MCRMRILVLFCTLVSISEGRLLCLGSRKNSSCVSLTQRIREIPFQTVCYARIGCFYSGPPWYHLVHRPFTIAPQSPDVLQPRYLLFTRRNRYKPQFLSDGDIKALNKSFFNPYACTRIFTHGWLQAPGLIVYYRYFKDNFLDKRDDNFIVFDWSGGAGPPYTLAVSNTRVAGALLANFIRFLIEETGTYPEQFHLIGQSLGAHIMGYAGERVPNIGRITGTDPAGPLYNYMPPEVVLDPTDALFVDIIHSDMGQNIVDGLGIALDAGHIDFWPWNGRVPLIQCINRVKAGIVEEDPPYEVIENGLGICLHYAGTEFFRFSFNQSHCLFVGARCKSWNNFLAGDCDCGEDGGQCKFLGYYAEPPSREDKLDSLRYFLITDLQRPYCLHQYVVKVYVRNLFRRKGKEYEEYPAELTIFGEENDLKSDIKLNFRLKNRRHQYQELKYVVTNPKSLGFVHSAVIKLKDDHQWHPVNASSFSVDKVEVTYLFPLPKKQTRFHLCKNWNCKRRCEYIFVLKAKNCHFHKHL